jgi:hypothetical protein
VCSERYRSVVNLVESFFTMFPSPPASGHHWKWREVDIMTELPGWRASARRAMAAIQQYGCIAQMQDRWAICFRFLD